MKKKTRLYESDTQAMPMRIKKVRLEQEDLSDAEMPLFLQQNGFPTNQFRYSFSREVILRLIEWFKQK